MSKPFKTWHVDQIMLLPPSVQDLVPEGHLAHFVRNTVRNSLDLSAIVDTYTEARGFPVHAWPTPHAPFRRPRRPSPA